METSIVTWRSVRHRLSGFLVLLAAVWPAGCGSRAGERLGYGVLVNIRGEPAAFEGARIEVDGVSVPAATTAPAGELQAEVMVCTASWDRFLQTPSVSIRVTKPDGQVIDSLIERYACRVSQDPGFGEYLYVRLRTDGSIDGQFGVNLDVYTTCVPPSFKFLCPIDNF